MVRRLALIVLALAAAGSAQPAEAQAPQTLPLVQAGDVTYMGSFAVPPIQGTQWVSEQAFTYGGYALGMGPDGQSLYLGGHDWHDTIARVSIPAMGGTARILDPLTSVPNLASIDPDAGNSFVLGGSLFYGGRLLVSAYVYYDANGNATASHFAAQPNLTGWSGPQRVGSLNPGFVGGYMGVIPPEWRAALGGPAFTGQCCIGIISRSSLGPSLSVFDPDDVAATSPAPSRMLLGYPSDHPTLGTWDSSHTLFNGATRIGGAAFVPGTRSVLFVGRHGDTFCYGDGAACNDPTDGTKGVHAYPYRHTVWAYDANDLVAVRNGAKQPWDVRPYAVFTLSGASSHGNASVTSVTFDPVARRIYMTTAYGESPRVHVWQVGPGSAATEACGDGIDNDGDGQVDEGCATPIEICGDGIDNDGDGAADEGCTQPVDAAPGAPTQMTGRVVDGTTVNLAWLAPITGGGPTGYVVEAGIEPGQALYTLPLDLVTSISVPNVGTGVYYVRVRARNASGTSLPSNEVRISVGCAKKPGQVKNVRANSRGAQVTFTWTDADGCGGTTYALAIGTTPGASDVGTVQTSAPVLTARTAPGTYYARVVSVNDFGVSEPSADLRLDVDGGCPPPPFLTRLSARVRGSEVRLSWAPVDPEQAALADAASPVAYRLEVGSVPSAADVAVFPMGRATSFTAVAPAGAFFVRVRPVDACGSGPASNEYLLEVR